MRERKWAGFPMAAGARAHPRRHGLGFLPKTGMLDDGSKFHRKGAMAEEAFLQIVYIKSIVSSS
jgi:hypothetical protein